MPISDSAPRLSRTVAESTRNSLHRTGSIIRPVSQVNVVLTSESADDSVLRAVRTVCLRWLNRRAGRPLPPQAWEGGSFELEEIGAQRVGAVGIDKPRYWAARLDDADKDVAQRTWVTEIGLGQNVAGAVLLGVRLLCVTRGEDPPFDPTIPGFVRDLLSAHEAFLDEYPVHKAPWVVDTADAVESLVRLICSPTRTCDVIVFSLPEGSIDITQTAAPADVVHQCTLGAAHVVILTGPATYSLTDRLGRDFSVFHQGVRSYLPGFDLDKDPPFRHPLGLAPRIAAWEDGGPSGYARMLVSRALARSVRRQDREDWLPSFAAVRRLAADQALKQGRDAGRSDKELLKLALEDNAQLRKDLEDQKRESDNLLAEADRQREQAEQAMLQAQARLDNLLVRIKSLEARLTQAGLQPADVPVPDTLDGFEDWCKAHLSGHVELLNRAYQGIKRSVYEDVSLIYRALLLLRDHYVPMRRQPSDASQLAYQQALQSLNLEEGASISRERYGEHGDTYVVRYAGRRRHLDRHLKKGVSRDPRYCFRLYFFWADEEQQVVVGWLPSHLDTTQT
jgi:hypothetical protein